MTERLADHLELDARGQAERSGAVPQIMEPNRRSGSSSATCTALSESR